jgi:hypothetical protein
MTPIKMFSVVKISLILSAIAFSSINTQAALYDRGNGMIYDSTQNITWLQDANYAQASGYNTDGRMNWTQANTWVDGLIYGGFSDWRLPSAGLIGDTTFSYDGSTDHAYNNTRSEIGHLFFELGNNSKYNTEGVPLPGKGSILSSVTFVDASTNLNVSFLNMHEAGLYWEAETYAPDMTNAWVFNLFGGVQHYYNVVNPGIVWAVRDGDVVPTVPVPAAAWLMGSGLIGLAGIARRKK